MRPHSGSHGSPKDQAEAATWFRRAAEQGHASAQYNLGVAYLRGRVPSKASPRP
jgi:TPR repeat protein